MAEALFAAYNAFDRHQDVAMQDEAMVCLSEQKREFGEAYQAIVKRAAGHQTYSL
jgi:hypothetical protein